MVWITMSLVPHVGNKKRKKTELNPHSQVNKCLNEKRRREQENIHIEELAELVSASPSDMSSLSCKPDKCAILKETVNQIRSQKRVLEGELQQSEVSSSKPNIIDDFIFGSILLEAIDGFLFIVDIDGIIQFVSDNIELFLKLPKGEIVNKNVYDFMHPDDRVQFNSNLLLMMPLGDTDTTLKGINTEKSLLTAIKFTTSLLLGNGHDWNTENIFSSIKSTKQFSCRFALKDAESEMKMDSVDPEYENFSLTLNCFSMNSETNNETGNILTCVARKVSDREKKMLINTVEQFTTRIDRDGKVVDIDVNCLSPPNGQYLRKELMGSLMSDFCHPSDVATFKQHLKETFETEGATCVPYKFRISPDRFVKIKTKSRRFRSVSSIEEFVVSTHCIIRDSDNFTLDSQKYASSPLSLASTSSGPGSVSDSSMSANGNVALSPMSLPNSFGNFPSSLVAMNSSDYNEVLDMFPGATWNLDPGSSQLKESGSASIQGCISSPRATPLSNCSDTSAASPPTNNAFVGVSSNRSTSSNPSPSMQNRAPTPYGGNVFSPSAVPQSSSGKTPPPRPMSAKLDPINCSTADTPNVNVLNISRQQYEAKSNQKLRNLLTQNIEDLSARQQASQHSAQNEVTVLVDTRIARNLLQNSPKANNVILRDLLNQDSSDSEPPVEPIMLNTGDGLIPNPLLNVGSCNQQASAAQHNLGNNNMLRKLLNDDGDGNYRKSQDLIQQLLQPNSNINRVSIMNDKLRQELMSNQNVNDKNMLSKAVSVEGNSSPDVTCIAMKRKANDRNFSATAPKKTNNGNQQHVHLAGQNPMLASMLAQTPRTPPTVPTSVASSIMTQLPQERLPKNLEKKLVHTPYIATSLNATTSSYVLTSQRTQQNAIASDSEGHVLISPPPNSQVQPSEGRVGYAHQPNIYEKVLSASEEGLAWAKELGIEISSANSTLLHNSGPFTSTQSSVPTSQSNALNEAVMFDIPLSDQSDPVFAEILDQIYSLQEDHNVEPARNADDQASIFKILGDVIDSPQEVLRPNLSISQDITEKMAISAIQKELMEVSSQALATRTSVSLSDNVAVIAPSYSHASRTLTQNLGVALAQSQLLQQQQAAASSSLRPNYGLIGNRVRISNPTQLSNIAQETLLAQRINSQAVRGVNIQNVITANAAQLNKTMKQRLYLQQQQKRLLEQQQKQQLAMQTQQPVEIISSPGTNIFQENMNDLLNNTVAPNVSLLRMSTENSASTHQRSPTPTQLSPKQQSPFPPPVPPPSYSSGTRANSNQSPAIASSNSSTVSSNLCVSSPSWNQRVATSPMQNLQLQNPMLNAQLSLASIGANQIRLTAQQRQQLAVQSIQGSNTVQNPKSTSLQSQSDSGFASLSPIMVLQSPSPQHIQSPQNQNPHLIQSSQQILAQTLQQLQSQALHLQTRTLQQQFQNQTSHQVQSKTAQPQSQIQSLQQPAQPQATQHQRVQNISAITSQTNLLGNDTIATPQSLSSPSFSQSSSPASAFVSITSASISNLSLSGQQFSFDCPPNYTRSSSDSTRSSSVSDHITTGTIKQQLILSPSNNQQLLQSLSSNPVTRVLNVNSLTRQELEDFGLGVEFLPGTSDAQSSSSQTSFMQGLLSDAASKQDSNAQSISPRVSNLESKAADQKKSLLQQLLSEPT